MAYSAILDLVGRLLLAFAAVMLVPLLVAASLGETGSLLAFAWSAAAAGFVGLLTTRAMSGRDQSLSRLDGFLLAGLGWTVMALFGALPLYLSLTTASFADALFEAWSGLTTTGISAIADPGAIDRSQVLWRAIMQWLGGFATILFGATVLSYLGAGVAADLRGAGPRPPPDALRPTLRQAMRLFAVVYAGLTGACAVALGVAGMAPLDALCYAMSTLSTGGFSTSVGSIAGFDSGPIDAIVILFMLAGAVSYPLYWLLLRGRIGAFAKDPELRFMTAIVVLAGAVVVIALFAAGQIGVGEGAHRGLFAVASAITTTGFASGLGAGAPSAIAMILIGLALIGGATGSTAGGIKLMRAQFLLRQSGRELNRLVSPHGMILMRYRDAAVPDDVLAAVWAFFAVHVFVLILLTVALAGLHQEPVAALAMAASALTNGGPLLAEVTGATQTVATLPLLSKLVLMGGMLAGRLEVLALLVVLTPMYWRR